MKLSFTTEYYPKLVELTAAQLEEARLQVVDLLRPAMPDVDLSPGTPTGDFIVAGLTAGMAAADVANSRLMSDLNLNNIADGIIYSCEFVREFLGNFGVYDVENTRAFGLVRLTFSSPSARTIPRTIRFRFNTPDDWSVKVSEPSAVQLNILAAGNAHNGAPDTYVLAQTSANTWAVDIPVEGVLSSPVSVAANGAATIVDADLVGIMAAISFSSGLPAASLPELAKMARKIAFSTTSGSRSSTRAMVYRNWPESTMVSPIVPGDAEMLRSAAGSAMLLQAPSVDLYHRSSHDMQRVTSFIRLDYVLTPGGFRRFRGALPTLHRASRVVSLEWSGTTVESLVADKTIYSLKGRADLYGSLHCGSRFESLFVEVEPVLDAFNLPMIPRLEDGVGNQYAIFAVTYDCDPLLETVASLLESPEHRPPGVDILVKSGPMLLIDDLTIRYVKQPGVKTTLSVARDKIVEYARTSGHPDQLRLPVIHDIMRNAGVEKVLNISGHGRVFVSPADKLFRSNVTDPLSTLNWASNSDFFQVIALSDLQEVMNPNSIISGNISIGGPADAWAATARTVRYVVDPEHITFIETS